MIYFIVFIEHKLDIELKDGKFLCLNLYEIRLEEKIINNKSLVEAFCFDCQCALFLVDKTNPESLKPVEDLILSINDNTYPYLKLILVENKSDIQQETHNNEIQKIINKYSNIDHIKISVKTGENIDNLLNKIYDGIISNSSEKNILPINIVSNYALKDYKEECKGTISLIFVGNTGVGKTNFLTRYVMNKFILKFLSTHGVNKEIKIVKISEKGKFTLILNDTSGQERYRSLPRSYYKNVDGILLLFDVHDKKTFDEVSIWMNEINEYSGKSETREDSGKKEKDLVIYLIGNKIDKNIEDDEEREVSKEEGEELAKKLGVKYYEVSCRWGLNIEEVMARIVFDCCKNYKSKSENLQLKKVSEDKRGGCCSSASSSKSGTKKDIKK